MVPRGKTFEWVEKLESPCMQIRGDIHNDALGKAGGDTRTCLMGLPITLLLSSVRQEIKRCFPHLPMAAHAAKSPNAIT